MKKLKEGEKYWYVYVVSDVATLNFGTLYFFWDNDKIDKVNLKTGNCFPTKREALQAISRMKKALKQR